MEETQATGGDCSLESRHRPNHDLAVVKGAQQLDRNPQFLADLALDPSGELAAIALSLHWPNAGLEEPALGGPAQEATQRRLFTAASSDIPPDFATALTES